MMESVTHGHTIELVTDASIAPIAQEIEAHFKGCTVQVGKDHRAHLISEERTALSPVLQYLDSKGISVFEAKELRPTLEDVFVKITGMDAQKLKKDREKGGLAK